MKRHFRVVSKPRVAFADEDFEFDLILKLEFATQILEAVGGWVERKRNGGDAG